jgi:hypothetical protein
MSVDYRPLQAADERAAIAWWAAAYKDDPTIITSAFRSDPQRFERSFVAQEPDGSICAAIAYWVRMLRDAAGAPCRVGHIWGIGTPGDAADIARQQHVDHLLDLAKRAAQHERCEMLLFYPALETHAHYQQRGWQLLPNPYRQGTFTGVQLPTTANYRIHQYDPTQEPEGWEHLAEIYHTYNAMRPASVIRDATYWRDYLSWRWGEWSAHGASIFLVATPVRDPTTLCGYVIPKFYSDTFLIAELGVHPSDTAVIPMLVAAVLEESTRRGIADHFRVYLPHEPQIDGWVDQLFRPAPQEGSYGAQAVYALDSAITQDDLKAMFTAPGSHLWLLDQF